MCIRQIICSLLLLAAAMPSHAVELDCSGLSAGGVPWEADDRLYVLCLRFGDEPNQDWASKINHQINEGKVSGLGVRLWRYDGPDFRNAESYNEDFLDLRRPHVVAMCPGLRNVLHIKDWVGESLPTAAAMAEQIRGFVASQQERNRIVLLLTPPRIIPADGDAEVRAALDRLAEAIRSVAEDEDIYLGDLRAEMARAIDGGAELIAEAGKLTEDGHHVLANALCRALGEGVGQVPCQVDLPGGGIEKGDSVAIELRRCAKPEAIEIRYTLDGTEPDAKAKVYKRPLKISKPTRIRVLATDTSSGQSIQAGAAYVPLRSRKADRLHSPEIGLAYSVHRLDGTPKDLATIEDLPMVAVGTFPSFDFSFLSEIPELGGSIENVGVIWRGAIVVPVDGVYTFFLKADDAAQLVMDDEVLVESRGFGSYNSGMIALSEGKHEVTIRYAQRGGLLRFQAAWRGPGFGLQHMPQTAFCHAADQIPELPKKR